MPAFYQKEKKKRMLMELEIQTRREYGTSDIEAHGTKLNPLNLID
jgi:hypothetical protein